MPPQTVTPEAGSGLAYVSAAASQDLLSTGPDADSLDRARLVRRATRWHASPICALFSHRWSTTQWSRWAFGWERELTCERCGQIRSEQAPYRG